MLGNVALDVFIGLVFVYLLYSLLATIIQEIIASFLNLRAIVLVKAIRIMLNDRAPVTFTGTSFLKRTWERLVYSLTTQWHYILCKLPDHSFAKAFYKHPSIKYLSPGVARSKPSYIEPSNFSKTVIQMLRGKHYDGSLPAMLCIYNTLFPMITAANNKPDTTRIEVGLIDPVTADIQPETLDKLRQVYIDSNRDLTRFMLALETWYNETMDRASGWYKRQTRRILFCIGLVIAIWGNVDSIKIYHVLSKDKNARDQMVQMAIQSQQKYQPYLTALRDTASARVRDSLSRTQLSTEDSLLNSAYNSVKNDLEQSNYVLAMGWHSSAGYQQYDSLLQEKSALQDSLKNHPADSLLQRQLAAVEQRVNSLEPVVYDKFDWSSSPLGWLITALALTLGAPFWFDLLSKFISLRATGKKPEEDTSSIAIEKRITASSGIIETSVVREAENQPEIVPDESQNGNIAQG